MLEKFQVPAHVLTSEVSLAQKDASAESGADQRYSEISVKPMLRNTVDGVIWFTALCEIHDFCSRLGQRKPPGAPGPVRKPCQQRAKMQNLVETWLF